MMYVRYFIGLLALFSIAIMAGCGSTSNVGTEPEPDRETAGFDLKVLDESFIDGSSAGDFSLSVDEYGDDIVLNVNVEDAQDLKALYVELAYDAEQFRPLRGVPAEEVGDRDEYLSLSYAADRGTVHYGQVLTNYEWRSGFTGSGTVAQIIFRKEAAPFIRQVSTPPGATSLPSISFDGVDTLTWSYVNVGDYDQNSQVNIADLTPLGANFNQSVAPADFPFNSNLSAIDGDSNGQLNIADLTPIGANFNRTASGWNVYESVDAGDVPATPDAANGAGATLTGNVAHGAAIGNTSSDRLSFELVVAAPVANSYYWVRATDGTTDGPASLPPAGGDPTTQPVLALTNPPGGGAGTEADPYIVNVTTAYVFSLTDPVDGDVSTDPLTTYTSSNGDTITNADATLNIDDAFEGDFFVTANYDGTPNRADTTVYMRVPPTGGGDLNILPDPADTDWDTVTGDGLTEDTAFVLHTDAFNPDGDADDVYDLEFTLVANTAADGSGDPIDVSGLTFFAVPPFAAFWSETTDATFQAGIFTNGTIQAQDGDSNLSNELWITVQSLPD